MNQDSGQLESQRKSIKDLCRPFDRIANWSELANEMMDRW